MPTVCVLLTHSVALRPEAPYFSILLCLTSDVLIKGRALALNGLKLEVTIARKMLPHPQRMEGSMRNLLNKGLFIRMISTFEISHGA
jgi:hypothetical protein